MADCDEILKDLYTFLDEELSPETREAIRAHLDGCLDCLQVFDFHAELKQIIARKCRDEMPPGLRERVMNFLAQPPPPPG